MLGFHIAVEAEMLLPSDDGQSSVQSVKIGNLNVVVVLVAVGSVSKGNSVPEMVAPLLRARESGRFSGGSSRFLGLRSRAEVRIPAPEGVLPLLVEYAGSYLQEEMRSTLAPSHLLFLHHSLAHYLIDRRLDETGSDPFPAAIALSRSSF